MAPRPTWQGHLRLSLVSCPVALYTATSRAADVSFHLINPKTNNRIRMVTTDPESGPVSRGDLVKGYEVEKDRYVILTQDEIDSVRLETTRTLNIERFVDEDEIDRLYWNDPYFLAPDGKVAAEAFSVIRDAMAAAGKIALGRLVMHTRERIMALEPRDKGILAYTIRSAAEVRDPDSVFDDIPKVKPDAEMIDIATKIIEQKAGSFDTGQFKDRYEEALKALIAQKEKGKKPTVAPAPEDTSVSDLMAALRKSLQGAARPSGRAATGRKTASAAPRRKTAARRKSA